MNQQQQQQNNQFNQYINNNVGTPASTVKIYISRFLSHNLLNELFRVAIQWMHYLDENTSFGSISKPAGLF